MNNNLTAALALPQLLSLFDLEYRKDHLVVREGLPQQCQGWKPILEPLVLDNNAIKVLIVASSAEKRQKVKLFQFRFSSKRLDGLNLSIRMFAELD